jgi:hypothetical protein
VIFDFFRCQLYFIQIWKVKANIRLVYLIRFSIFLAVSCKNGFFGSQNFKGSLYKVRNFFSQNRPIWVSKDPYFYADFKKLNSP